VRRYCEPELAALIIKDRKDARGEVGKLDFDPFIDAQDWEIVASRTSSPAFQEKKIGSPHTRRRHFESLLMGAKASLPLNRGHGSSERRSAVYITTTSLPTSKFSFFAVYFRILRTRPARTRGKPGHGLPRDSFIKGERSGIGEHRLHNGSGAKSVTMARAWRIKMATWKRLTDSDGAQIDVNMDEVCFISHGEDYTTLYFSAGIGERFLTRNVRQRADEIHLMPPLRST
jgi:hypothetical protein